MALPKTRASTRRVSLFRTTIGDDAVDAAAAVLRSGWIGIGPIVEQFLMLQGKTVSAVLPASGVAQAFRPAGQEAARWL